MRLGGFLLGSRLSILGWEYPFVVQQETGAQVPADGKYQYFQDIQLLTLKVVFGSFFVFKPFLILARQNDRNGCAPCKGGVFQWVRVPPGNFAPAGSNRSSHGGNEVAEASDIKGHFR